MRARAGAVQARSTPAVTVSQKRLRKACRVASGSSKAAGGGVGAGSTRRSVNPAGTHATSTFKVRGSTDAGSDTTKSRDWPNCSAPRGTCSSLLAAFGGSPDARLEVLLVPLARSATGSGSCPPRH